jgi:hypothetical protein
MTKTLTLALLIGVAATAANAGFAEDARNHGYVSGAYELLCQLLAPRSKRAAARSGRASGHELTTSQSRLSSNPLALPRT